MPIVRRFRERVARIAGLHHRLADLAERVDENTRRTNVVAARLEVLIREHRLLAQQVSLPPEPTWKHGPPRTPGASAAVAFPFSTVCRQESFEQQLFHHWMERLGFTARYHRKLWEFAFICQVLEERGLIRQGARGLGFGVGREPLSALFASRGCQIVATDMAAADAAVAGWTTAEHAEGKENLRAAGVCPDDLFDANVAFRLCDMNAVPVDLTGFDFCWSACALEHLGTIEHGLTFIERSLDCLAPGGVAVHTTEFNVASDNETLTSGPAVIFRRRDMEELRRRVDARGFEMAPFDFNPGEQPLDRYVDLPPYLDQPHLKLALEGYVSTSIGLIIRRPA